MILLSRGKDGKKECQPGKFPDQAAPAKEKIPGLARTKTTDFQAILAM
jgi:hypothetical protein